jgi:hypothetical protein
VSIKIGEAEVYDLVGNLAEYYEGGTYGYSAYDYCDPSDDSMITSKHVGFRLVLNP